MNLPSNSDLIERLNSSFDDENKLTKICGEIAADIQGGKRKIFEAVELLQEFLVNVDVNLRENGVRALAIILEKLSSDYLNEKELDVLTSFMIDRLNDHHSIIPVVISAILSIIQMKNLPSESPVKLLRQMLEKVTCAAETVQIRRNIYLIFQTIIRNHLKHVKPMELEFVNGFLNAMDGESDPRNLMLLFDFIPDVLQNFPLNHLTEEMFEVISCYFPIDFNPEKNKGEITREMLAEKLERCLCAIPEFAEFAMPLLIEKLDSELKVARSDSLKLLTRGSSVFSCAGIKNHLSELWPLLRREVLPGHDQELKAETFKAITEVTRALSIEENTLQRFIDTIIVDTKSSLCDVQLSLFWPAEKLLETVAKADVNCCKLVLKVIVPLSLGQYSTKTAKADKIILMETLNNFLAISADFGMKISDIPELTWTDLPGLYLTELSGDIDIKIKAYNGLSIQKLSLPECHRKTFYERICTEINTENNDQKLLESCHSALISFAKLYPSEVSDLIFNQLVLEKENIPILKQRLDALASIGRVKELGPQILPKIIQVINNNSIEISLLPLSCLQKMLLSNSFEFDITYFLYEDCSLLEKIINPLIFNDKLQIRLISNISQLIIRKLNENDQKTVVDKYFNVLKEEIEQNVILLEGILIPLMPNNIYQESIDLLEKLINILLNMNDRDIQTSCYKIISIIVNKMDSNLLEKHLNKFSESIKLILQDSQRDLSIKKAAVTLHTWLTKALVSRGDKISQQFLEYQINLLRNEIVGDFVGENFRILVDKNEDTLSENNYCTVKMYYKQKIFHNLITSNEKFEGQSRQNYLIALVHLTEEIPLELLIMHLKTLVSLLIESLSLDNGELLLSSLKTLKLLFDTKNDIFVDQIASFLPKCLKLSTYPKMSVRIAALNCIYSYCNYPTEIIKPYKDDVLDELTKTIDDKKRLVRQTASNARARWYLVGSVGEPE